MLDILFGEGVLLDLIKQKGWDSSRVKLIPKFINFPLYRAIVPIITKSTLFII